jgi:hypothetical protein
MIYPEQARNVFLEMIVNHVYKGVVSDLSDLLANIGQTSNLPEELLKLITWYQKIAINDRKQIDLIIKEATYRSVFLLPCNTRQYGRKSTT